MGGVLLVEAVARNVFLNGGEEASRFDRVGKEECGAETDEDGEQAFDDEDPAPAFETAGGTNSVETTCEETSECATERSSRIEDANT